ncbi:MAG TPA: hypothetical protein VGR55_01860 [Candidatus Acidoferrum sp.]|nr:hypothetical protein [Candidatus Acidoferrum sp.]
MIIAGDAEFGNSEAWIERPAEGQLCRTSRPRRWRTRDDRHYLRYSLGKMRTLVGLTIMFLAAVSTQAQTCPQNSDNPDTPGPSVALHGTLIYHDDLRQWLGLRLDHPVCGETEVELVFSNSSAWRRAQSLRGCTLTARGTLYESPTGYYSAKFAIEATLKSDPSCRPFPVRPDLSTVPIPTTVRIFRASIVVDYRGKGHVGVEVWKNRGKRLLLKPWQAYVNYILTGGRDVIWFGCQKDFRIANVTQTPKSPGGIFADAPDLTGAALQDLDATNTISFSCQRISTAGDTPPKRPHAKPK